MIGSMKLVIPSNRKPIHVAFCATLGDTRSEGHAAVKAAAVGGAVTVRVGDGASRGGGENDRIGFRQAGRQE